ncbi:MAG TPA: BON domain-containing protein [Nostocaceae cyanobacterium]|nr:BON domain-containing protein [Nostocaceae cyanobacterium]
MKKLIPFLISGILVTGVFGCQEATKTGSETPANNSETSSAPAKPASQTTQTTDKTTKSPTEKTTTPTATTPAATTKDSDNLKTAVKEQLQKSLPGNKLEIDSKGSEIIIKGAAASQEELTKAETLAKSVKGVKTVKVEAKVAPAKKP